MTFIEHHVYRIAYNADRKELRGKPVVFLGWREGRLGDITRAIVHLLDEPADSVWLVARGLLIP